MSKVAKKSTTKVTGSMRVNAYAVLSRAVTEGVASGWVRAHKHTDAPEGAALQEAIETAVLNAICEIFEFEDTYK